MTDYQAFAALFIFGLPALMFGVMLVTIAVVWIYEAVRNEMY
jgi:hypothetical protein